MEKIGNITKKIFKNKNLEKAANAAFVCSVANKILKEFFDHDFTKNAKAFSFRDGNLTFAVSNNFYAQEIKLKEKEIIEAVNKKLSEGIVRKIKFKSLDIQSKYNF